MYVSPWIASRAISAAAEADHKIHEPVLFFACQKDYICVPVLSGRMSEQCKNLTVKDLDAGHWAMLEVPDQFNAGLLEWLNGFVVKA